ncbi:hypothetical protein F2Q68_00040147 [Brassica cretica]|uniref:Uncharacterized protein n=1 Tax=Brassica cretica TaxID=69181 RepID=A0A8S9MAZ9_BRACR|nr:hypothetical protein F2Q68_00040147 [Brassica cretica]
MEGSPYRKFSISRRKGSDSGTGPKKFHSREPELLLVGILGTGVPSSGDPEAGVLPGVWRNSTPEPLILVEDRELWASDDVLETVEPISLMFPEEELS